MTGGKLSGSRVDSATSSLFPQHELQKADDTEFALNKTIPNGFLVSRLFRAGKTTTNSLT